MRNNTHQKGVLKGSLAFMQHFKFVNSWFCFLMSRTGYELIESQYLSVKKIPLEFVKNFCQKKIISNNILYTKVRRSRAWPYLGTVPIISFKVGLKIITEKLSNYLSLGSKVRHCHSHAAAHIQICTCDSQ